MYVLRPENTQSPDHLDFTLSQPRGGWKNADAELTDWTG